MEKLGLHLTSELDERQLIEPVFIICMFDVFTIVSRSSGVELDEALKRKLHGERRTR